jgi:predicted anti-sigma-YlaC factor YlaD
MNHFLLRHWVHTVNALAELDRTIVEADAVDDDLEAIERPGRRDLGQATTEYALVMLGAAAVALLVVTWATAGGGAGRIGRLFDRVIDAVLGRI